MNITLTSDQKNEAIVWAHKVNKSKVWTQNWAVDNLKLGRYGEIAYSMMTGQATDEGVYTTRGDGGIDFADGADVKTSSWKGADVELKLSKLPKKVDEGKKLVLAQLVEETDDSVTINLHGEIPLTLFCEKATLRTRGRSTWYGIGVEDLTTLYDV
jgi:hypothetical protein